MSGRKSDYEEKLLTDLLTKYQSLGIVVYGEIEGAPGTYAKILVKSDGTVKVEGVTTISGTVDVSDRWARQLGEVDIARYLGSAIGLANPLHSQIVYGGVVIDPRSIRALLSSDVVTAYGSQTQALLQRATTYDLIVQLRTAGVEYDARQIRALTSSDVVDVSDKATRLLGVVYGSQAQQLLQRATTYDLLVQLRHAGVEIDPRQIRALTASDKVTTLMEDRTYDHATFDASASGDLVAAVAGKVIKVHAITIQAAGTVVVNINDGSGGASLAEWTFQAREGVVYSFAPYPAHWFQTSVNTALYVTLSAAVVVTSNVIYTDDDAT